MIFVDKRLTAKHLLVFLLAASLTGCTESVPVPENTKTAEAKEQKEVEKKMEEADDRSAETTETDMNQRTEMNASHGQSDEYIFPESTEDIISYENIVNKSDEELRLGRNEIFARHGRIFASPDLQTYFEGKSWYNGTILPEQFSDSMLSRVELNNVHEISNVEFQRKIAGNGKTYRYKYVRTESSNGEVSEDSWYKGYEATVKETDLDHAMIAIKGILDDEGNEHEFQRSGPSFDAYIDMYGEPMWCICTFGSEELSMYIDGNDRCTFFRLEI